MAYARFGMTNAEAERLTQVGAGDGTTLTDAILEAAEADLEDALGFELLEDELDPDSWAFTTVGRAVAWQGAYRHLAGPDALAGTVANDATKSENIGDYSYTLEDGAAVSSPPVAPRARDLLARSGLLAERMAGRTSQPTGRIRRA